MADEDNAAAPAASDSEDAPSLRETLAAKYDEIQARDTVPRNTEDVAPEKPAEIEKPEGERARGPDGKFVAKTEATATETPATTTPETPAAAPAIAAQPEAAKAAPVEEATTPVPRTWQNEQRRQLFIKAPPEVRKALAEREAEMEAGVAKLQQRYGGYEQLVAPIRQQLAMEGRSPEQYLSALMAADEMLRTNPQQALGQIARMYGVNYGAQSAGQEQQAPDQYYREIQTLKNELAQLKAAPQQAVQHEAMSQIEQFAADPANVHFERVKPIMSSLLQSGVASTLKEAYDNAVQAHPEARKLIDADRAAQAQAAQAEAAKKAAADAQRMAAVNTATRGGAGSTATPAKSMRETMQRVADKLYGANA